MEDQARADLVVLFSGWILSSFISVIIVYFVNFGFAVNEWNIELTLLIIWSFGIVSVLITLTLIIIFLNRYKIVRK